MRWARATVRWAAALVLVPMVVSFCALISVRFVSDTVLSQETFNNIILGGWAAGTLLGVAFLRLGWLGAGPSEKLPEKGR